MHTLLPGFIAALTALTALTGHSWFERQTFLMGTTLRIRVAAEDRAEAYGAVEHAFGQVAAWEDRLSTWRPDTELSRFNATSSGVSVLLSRCVTDVLLEARRWSRRTDGAFDPAVGALIDAWQLRGGGVVPSPGAVDSALAASGLSRFAFDSAAGTGTRLHPDAWLDSGAWAKGLALRAARDALENDGIATAVLNFGGQILVLGPSPTNEPWTISVAHPERRHQPVLSLMLKPGQSAATTSISERRLELDGHTVGHVLDPRTGRPVTGWGSVTVVASDPLVADVLSTALFVMGPEVALDWADRHPAVGVVVVPSATGKPQWSPSLDGAVDVAQPVGESEDER